jgi:hypothetical protein
VRAAQMVGGFLHSLNVGVDRHAVPVGLDANAHQHASRGNAAASASTC